jgi:hypothetical protein
MEDLEIYAIFDPKLNLYYRRHNHWEGEATWFDLYDLAEILKSFHPDDLKYSGYKVVARNAS